MTIIAYDGRYLAADSRSYAQIHEHSARCDICDGKIEKMALATTKIVLINGASSYKNKRIVAVARSGRRNLTESIIAMLQDGLSVDAFLTFGGQKPSPLVNRDIEPSSVTVIFEDCQCGTLQINKDGLAKFKSSNDRLMNGCGLFDVLGIERFTGKKLTAIQKVRIAIESSRNCGGDIHYIDMNDYPNLEVKTMKITPLGKTPAERWSALLSYKPKG